jgi:hypothetical protein
MNQEDLRADGEAVYFSALASLDELPHGMRVLVVLNWVKYIMARFTDRIVPENEPNLAPVFAVLCAEFSEMVLELPVTFAEQLDASPCGQCSECVKERKARSERPTEPAPKGEVVN